MGALLAAATLENESAANTAGANSCLNILAFLVANDKGRRMPGRETPLDGLAKLAES